MRYQVDDYNIDSYDVAWENFMFGGIVHQISPPASPMAPEGVAVQIVPRISADGEEAEDVFAALSMEWINDQFSSCLWSDTGRENERAPGLHVVPRIRAREPAVVGGRNPFLPVSSHL